MLLIILVALSVSASPAQDVGDVDDLRARVKQYALLPNVDQRECANDFFTLADACVMEGRHEEAVSLYEQGLRVDPRRLEYQLKLARLLQQTGHEEEAIGKARVVYEYAEQEEQIAAARELLTELNAPPGNDGESERSSKSSDGVEIVIVPIGPVNVTLLAELKQALQQKLGIRFAIAPYSLLPGEADRNQVDRYLAKTIEAIKAGMPKKVYDELLRETGVTEESLCHPGAKVRFIEAILWHSGYPQSEIEAFRKNLAEKFRETHQYDAGRLLATLRRTHAVVSRTHVVGYFGVTEADIFSRDYNFLYGWGEPGCALMSYHRYTAEFNGTAPNRPKLLERSLKQGISSTFFILGIPRCTSPACARAYPHTLIEHDQKTCELCPECKQTLARVKAENKASVSKR